MSRDLKIKVYPVSNRELIGTVKVNRDAQENSSLVETIIILDKSGSMGQQAGRMANTIIPLFLSKLFYPDQQVIHLITFDNNSLYTANTVDQLKILHVQGDGGTEMTSAVQTCHNMFGHFVNTLGQLKPVRLLTISDGEIQDQDATEKAAHELAKFLENHDFTINSQAVRLFTSSQQPDTRALASLLQLNNVTASSLTDISSSESDEEISEMIADLFRGDNLTKVLHMTSANQILVKHPWDEKTAANIALVPGENLFWLRGNSKSFVKITIINQLRGRSTWGLFI